MTFAGQVICGGCVSLTVTVKVQVGPAESEQLTVVVPFGKKEPEAGAQVIMPLHWVPVWERERYRVPSGHAVLWLDPGLAFGTGNHETTRLCVERLVAVAEEHPPAGRSVIDAGCDARRKTSEASASKVLYSMLVLLYAMCATTEVDRRR